MRRRTIEIVKDSPSVSILASIPYVGIVKAEELLKLFKTPGNALKRENIDSWIEINGITQDRLDKIKEILYGIDL